MSKISDIFERRDAFQGFIMTIQASPNSIMTASTNVVDTITSILFAIVSWHLPAYGVPSSNILSGPYRFVPFPSEFPDLVQGISLLLHHLKSAVGAEVWLEVDKHMPVNVRRLLRESYQLDST